MKRLIVEREQLIKAIAQLTHAEIDRSQFSWIVAFDPTEEQPTAEVSLPDRMNSQGGFHDPDREGSEESPEVADASPEPAMVTPLEFSTLPNDFRWQGPMPDPAQPMGWAEGDAGKIVEEVGRSLRNEVIIDGERYQVVYR